MLRAVNVGGTGKVPMAGLRALCEELGLEGVTSIGASGNLAFRAKAKGAAELEEKLAAGCQERFGVDTEIFVRSQDEWRAALAANPFPEEAKRDPAHLIVMPLRHAPAAEAVLALQKIAATLGREQLRCVGRELYLTYPDGAGESKLTIKRIEKALATQGTGRNWNTALKLLAALA